jgi:hypothetical protein
MRWDPFNPRAEGLPGLTATLSPNAATRIIFYTSALHLPERGIGLAFTDGDRVVSESPFALPPQDTTELFGTEALTRYRLDVPALDGLVLKPAAAIAAEARGGALGSRVRLAYAYKPMPALALGYQGALRLDSSDVRIQISPEVVYHHVLSADASLGEANAPWGATLSALREIPLAPTRLPRSGYTVTRYSAATVVGPSIRGRIALPGGGELGATLGFLKVWDGRVRDQGALAPASGSIFEPRYLYREAWRPELRLRPPGSFGRKLSATAALTQDTEQGFAHVAFGLGVQATSAFSLWLGADLFSGSESASSSDASYLRQFIAHDRTTLELRYVL